MMSRDAEIAIGRVHALRESLTMRCVPPGVTAAYHALCREVREWAVGDLPEGADVSSNGTPNLDTEIEEASGRMHNLRSRRWRGATAASAPKKPETTKAASIAVRGQREHKQKSATDDLPDGYPFGFGEPVGAGPVAEANHAPGQGGFAITLIDEVSPPSAGALEASFLAGHELVTRLVMQALPALPKSEVALPDLDLDAIRASFERLKATQGKASAPDPEREPLRGQDPASATNPHPKP